MIFRTHEGEYKPWKKATDLERFRYFVDNGDRSTAEYLFRTRNLGITTEEAQELLRQSEGNRNKPRDKRNERAFLEESRDAFQRYIAGEANCLLPRDWKSVDEINKRVVPSFLIKAAAILRGYTHVEAKAINPLSLGEPNRITGIYQGEFVVNAYNALGDHAFNAPYLVEKCVPHTVFGTLTSGEKLVGIGIEGLRNAQQALMPDTFGRVEMEYDPKTFQVTNLRIQSGETVQALASEIIQRGRDLQKMSR